MQHSFFNVFWKTEGEININPLYWIINALRTWSQDCLLNIPRSLQFLIIIGKNFINWSLFISFIKLKIINVLFTILKLSESFFNPDKVLSLKVLDILSLENVSFFNIIDNFSIKAFIIVG